MQKNKTIKNIISLGFDCEAGLYMENNGMKCSSFFRFTLQDTNSLINIINSDFNNIFLFNNLRPRNESMIKDHKYNIAFHTKNSAKLVDGHWTYKYSTEKIMKIYQNEYEKHQFLIQKWRDLIIYNDKVGTDIYYLLKVKEVDLALINKLILALKKFQNNDKFKLVVLNLEVENLEDNRMLFKKMQRFAPGEDANNWHKQSWDEVFRCILLDEKTCRDKERERIFILRKWFMGIKQKLSKLE